MSEPQPSSISGPVDSAMKFGEKFGIPALLLCAYFGFDLAQQAGWVPNPVENRLGTIEKEIQEIKGQGIKHDTSMTELTKAVEAQGEQLEEEAKGRQMRCVMRATTDAEKKACFPNNKE